jgi:hypothetical protein
MCTFKRRVVAPDEQHFANDQMNARFSNMQDPKDIMISGTIDRQLVVVVVVASAEREQQDAAEAPGRPHHDVLVGRDSPHHRHTMGVPVSGNPDRGVVLPAVNETVRH